MSELKHTPSPWKILPEEVGRNYIRIRGTVLGGKYKIANILHAEGDFGHFHDKEAEEVRANARLIATAPEMLEFMINKLKSDYEEDTLRGSHLYSLLNIDMIKLVQRVTGKKIEEVLK